tara:strand:+ start:139 stop:534 length:396 start_codon:yes stop_codon:yes gene_type:complete
MAQRIKILGFRNEILINAEEVMYTEVSGGKNEPIVSIYFNNMNTVKNVGEKALEIPNGLIALNLYLVESKKGEEEVFIRANSLLKDINKALTSNERRSIIQVARHSYGQISQALWQVNDVTPKKRVMQPIK